MLIYPFNVRFTLCTSIILHRIHEKIHKKRTMLQLNGMLKYNRFCVPHGGNKSKSTRLKLQQYTTIIKYR